MLDRLGFPEVGPHRRFVTAIVVDTVGSGLFMPITLLYFLAVSDLTLVQVGAALSVSALVTLPSAVLVGSVVDRYGARLVMLVGNLLQAGGMLAYLWSHSFWAVAVATSVLNIGRQSFWGSFGNIVTAISRPGERETWFGFLQALRNLGFAVGGLLAGLALQIGTSTAYHAVVWINAASFVAAFLLLLDVPDHRPVVADEVPPGGWAVVLRDRGFRRLLLAQLGFVVGMMVLNFALPVYAARTIGLPGWVVGAVFTVNTILVGLGQGLVVRAMSGRVRARMMALAQGMFVAGYLLFVLAGVIPVWLGVVVFLVGGAVYTLGELTGGPVFSATAAESAPDHLRGRYFSLFQFAWGIGGVLAPVAFTALLDHGRFPIWVVLTVVAAAAAALTLTLPRLLPTAAQPVSPGAEG